MVLFFTPGSPDDDTYPGPDMRTHTDPSAVIDVKMTHTPRHGQTVTGYGPALPTPYMLRYGSRWHRVKVASYGNAGTVYITAGGRDLILDTDTEYRVIAMRDGAQ